MYQSSAYQSSATKTALVLAATAILTGCTRNAPYGLAPRPESQPFLHMPALADGQLPPLLSQTGVFADTARQIPAEGLIPYDLIVAFWSDGAAKSRWVALPAKVTFTPTGEWSFPPGSVFVKTFELPTDATNPGVRRRLETRLLVRDSAGGVYGAVYKWRADGSDADLLGSARTEDIPVKAANGETHMQTWYYPSRQDCLACHTALAGRVLGLKTRQMNRPYTYPSGITDNELRAWNHIGLFTQTLEENQLPNYPALAALNDTSRSLQDRARSYLDANCSQCHRPGGTVANFDARYDTPLSRQALLDGPVLIDQGIDRPRVISPHDIWRSIVYMRANTTGDIKMPPLARETVDYKGVQLLKEWINSLPGGPVLAPPLISPAGGHFAQAVDVTLSSGESGADIRYTLDGSVPSAADARYENPIKLTAPAVLRARVYKQGFTRSITEQQVFIVEK